MNQAVSAPDCASCHHPEADHQWEARRHAGIIEVGRCAVFINQNPLLIDVMMQGESPYRSPCLCDGYSTAAPVDDLKQEFLAEELQKMGHAMAYSEQTNPIPGEVHLAHGLAPSGRAVPIRVDEGWVRACQGFNGRWNAWV